MKPIEAMDEEKRIELIAALLMSQPWTLVACGLGNIRGEELARHLLGIGDNKGTARPSPPRDGAE